MSQTENTLFADALKYISKFKAAKQLIEDIKFLIKAAKEHPFKYGAIVAAALAYLISPFDAIPDVIPVAGLVDDIGVVAAAVATIKGMMS